MTNYIEHKPVMAKQVAELLVSNEEGIYVDATAGSGGHLGLLANTYPEASFIGIDIDPEAVQFLAEKFAGVSNVRIIRGNYADLPDILHSMEIAQVDGILLDLGISMHQALSAQRGFSIKNPGPLDMRFSIDQEVTAYELVNSLSEEQLADIIYRYGEERRARKIAKAVVEARKVKPLETTDELADLVARTVGYRGRIHPATRVFQALRIATNRELDNLQVALPRIFQVLKEGGRLAVISYHSLEDRIVKQFFKTWEEEGKGLRLTKKVVKPSLEEINENPSSRSAKLRVFKKGVGGNEN